MRHIFIIGAKGLGNYGGYETFVDKLTEYHQNVSGIKYHIACKYNGQGYMDEDDLQGVKKINNFEFEYHGAHCFKLKVPEIGSAQAVFYDVVALKYCCEYIKKHNIKNPIVYVLSSRVGPVMNHYVKKIHRYNGKVWHNPDGRENLRIKYKPIVRKYWKFSEKLAVKYSDLEICDSKHIEKYIREEYQKYNPQTVFVAYGADIKQSSVRDEEARLVSWMQQYQLSKNNYYLIVGRFVPENNFETMIKEFLTSHSTKDLVIITNVNDKFLQQLESKLHFEKDTRIKFVGTVYEKELLKKIRESAYAYFHGHEVGGTNPSLLEALCSTNLNLLLDVGFNREVAEDTALYWNKEDGNLAALIGDVEQLNAETLSQYGVRAKTRISEAYNWAFIADQYKKMIIN